MTARSPAPEIVLQTVSVRADGGGHEGRLVFSGNDLVAVMVRVTAEENAGSETGKGGWFLEAGFGPCSILMATPPAVFMTIEEAISWVQDQLDADPY